LFSHLTACFSFFAYALLGEIKTASEQRRGKTKAQLEALVSGKILKKYREMKYISNEIKLNRHRLAKVKSKQLVLLLLE
jgi:hypothetical protein